MWFLPELSKVAWATMCPAIQILFLRRGRGTIQQENLVCKKFFSRSVFLQLAQKLDAKKWNTPPALMSP
jgi:hypothetical protein